jgi:hypothetical protein
MTFGGLSSGSESCKESDICNNIQYLGEVDLNERNYECFDQYCR